MKRFALVVIALLAAMIVLPPLWFAAFPAERTELPPPESFVDLSTGNRMHYLEAGGDGPPIVLVHGLPGTAYDWKALVPALAASGRRVLAIDRIGYGYSGPRVDGNYSLRANTEDLLAFLEALDLEDALVVGWSYGGVMAMDAAVVDPSRIASIALVASGGPRSADDSPPEAGAAVRFFYSGPVLRWRSWVPPLAHGLMSVLSAQAFSEGPQPDWWLPQLQANFARWETTWSYRGEILAPIETVLALDAIELPTLVVHGPTTGSHLSRSGATCRRRFPVLSTWRSTVGHTCCP